MFWIVGAGVLALLGALGVWGYLSVKGFQDVAYAAKGDAVAAARAIEAGKPAEAARLFESAELGFTRAEERLGPVALQDLPWAGRQLTAARDLTAIGREGSAAGAEAAQLLAQLEAVPEGDDRLSVVLGLAHPHLESALESLVAVTERARGLTSDGLVPPLADAVASVNEVLVPIRPLLERSEALLELERYLFSGQHRFLIVAQNSSELRPTGGFMGTYGLLHLGPDGFAMDEFADIYTLPRDTLNEPLPPGGQVNDKHFYFRNTNWWMDFPTSAAMMLKFWKNLQQPQIDGIIAVDIPMLQQLLRVYGPIEIPESSKPLTAQNVMEQLNYVVQYESGGAGPKKKSAVVSLVAEVVRRVTSLETALARPTLAALAKSANEKHIQVFFTDPPAQAAMVTAGWSGAIAAPEGTTDLLAVSNGVIDPSKANWEVTKSLDYQVALAADGVADTTLTAGYHKSAKYQYGVPQQWLANYTRVHRLAGTQAVKGGDEFESLVDATGLPTFGRYFRLDPGKSKELVLRTSVPNAVRADGTGRRHYRLLVAKQADLVNTDLAVTVVAPTGWQLTAATAVARVSGAELPVTTDTSSVRLATPLEQDVVLDVTLVQA